MKTKFIVLSVLLSAGLVTTALAAGRGAGRNGSGGNANCTGVPVRDGSGQVRPDRGNPNSSGTPVRDGSGRATAPGQGAKDGTGNNANCPNPPTR